MEIYSEENDVILQQGWERVGLEFVYKRSNDYDDRGENLVEDSKSLSVLDIWERVIANLPKLTENRWTLKN